MGELFFNNKNELIYCEYDGKKAKIFIVNKLIREHDYLWFFTLCPDGYGIAYVARQGNNYFVMNNKEKWSEYNGTLNAPILFDKNGRLITVMQKDENWVIQIDNKEIDSFSQVATGSPFLNDTKEEFIVVGEKDGIWKRYEF